MDKSQKRTVLSPLPLASLLPSGLKYRSTMLSAWPTTRDTIESHDGGRQTLTGDGRAALGDGPHAEHGLGLVHNREHLLCGQLLLIDDLSDARCDLLLVHEERIRERVVVLSDAIASDLAYHHGYSLTFARSLLTRIWSCSGVIPTGSSRLGPVSSPLSLLNCARTLRSSGRSETATLACAWLLNCCCQYISLLRSIWLETTPLEVRHSPFGDEYMRLADLSLAALHLEGRHGRRRTCVFEREKVPTWQFTLSSSSSLSSRQSTCTSSKRPCTRRTSNSLLPSLCRSPTRLLLLRQLARRLQRTRSSRTQIGRAAPRLAPFSSTRPLSPWSRYLAASMHGPSVIKRAQPR